VASQPSISERGGSNSCLEQLPVDTGLQSGGTFGMAGFIKILLGLPCSWHYSGTLEQATLWTSGALGAHLAASSWVFLEGSCPAARPVGRKIPSKMNRKAVR